MATSEIFLPDGWVMPKPYNNNDTERLRLGTCTYISFWLPVQLLCLCNNCQQWNRWLLILALGSDSSSSTLSNTVPSIPTYLKIPHVMWLLTIRRSRAVQSRPPTSDYWVFDDLLHWIARVSEWMSLSVLSLDMPSLFLLTMTIPIFND